MVLSRQERNTVEDRIAALLSLAWVVLLVSGPLSGAAATAPFAAAERPDRLELLSGEVLHGKPALYDAQAGLRWQHPAVRQPIEIGPNTIGTIKFGGSQSKQSAPRLPCNIYLTNGDELLGELISMDEQKVQLQTWYAGLIAVPRTMVRAMTFGSTGPAVVYEGPTGLDGWKIGATAVFGRQSDQGWRYTNGAFVANGYSWIGRDFKLPDAVNIEFDFASTGYLQFLVSLYSDTTEGYGGNTYWLQLLSGSASISRISRQGGSVGLGLFEIPALARKNKAHVGIRVNKAKRTFALFVDGTLMKEWTDGRDFAGLGTSLLFHQQGQGALKLTNLRITQWDTRYDDWLSLTNTATNDLVKLMNNDKISGNLHAIKADTMTIAMASTTLEVPLARVLQIQLPGGPSAAPSPNPGEVQAYFAGRGSITFRIERWENGQITGNSSNFGRMKFASAALSRIRFNLDRTRPETEPPDLDDWEFDN